MLMVYAIVALLATPGIAVMFLFVKMAVPLIWLFVSVSLGITETSARKVTVWVAFFSEHFDKA